MNWEQRACMKVSNDFSSFEKIQRGVRQGCVLSPDLFSLYSENILKLLEDFPGIKFGGNMINNLRYADDTLLIAENEEDLQILLDIVVKESPKCLELNCKKTEVVVVSRKADTPKCNIFINGTPLKQCESFKYLGSLICSDGRNDKEILSRKGQVKMCFQKMKPILSNTQLSIDTRKRTLQCYIEPILMYGCEAWTINKQIQKKLEAVEMWFLRRMLRIPWTAKKTNQEVLKEAVTERSLINRIRN